MTNEKSEMNSIYTSDTWELVPLPPDKTPLPCKCVPLQVRVPIRNPKYKAQLLANGFKQEKDIDYDEVFSPVVIMTTLYLLLKVLAIGYLELKQVDVKTSLLMETYTKINSCLNR